MCLQSLKRFELNYKLIAILIRRRHEKSSLLRAFQKRVIDNNYRNLSNNSYDFLKTRGLLKTHFPEKEDINELLSQKRTIYAGFDATADSLHVGNALVLISLIHLYRCGHRVIVLIGDSTARIGDPSGKTDERPFIEKELVDNYADSIEKSVQKIFTNHEIYFWKNKGRSDRPGELIIHRNSEWYNDKNVIDFISNFGRYLRMGSMLRMKSLRDRIENPPGLSFSEFSYQLFQSYDWLYLYTKYNCDFQLGGVDQTVNVDNGHNLIKRLTDKQSYGLFTPLITDEKGFKLGKSEYKTYYLNANRTSPYSLYQYFHRLADTEIHQFFKWFSFRSNAEIEQMFQKQLQSPKPWYLQQKLAEEVVLLIHGEDGLYSAKKTTEALFKKDANVLSKLSDDEIDDVFSGAPKCTLLFDPNEMTVLDLAMKAKCFDSRYKALRIIQDGGFYINYSKVCSPSQVLSEKDILSNNMTLLSVGKRNYHIVKWY